MHVTSLPHLGHLPGPTPHSNPSGPWRSLVSNQSSAPSPFTLPPAASPTPTHSPAPPTCTFALHALKFTFLLPCCPLPLPAPASAATGLWVRNAACCCHSVQTRCFLPGTALLEGRSCCASLNPPRLSPLPGPSLVSEPHRAHGTQRRHRGLSGSACLVRLSFLILAFISLLIEVASHRGVIKVLENLRLLITSNGLGTLVRIYIHPFN